MILYIDALFGSRSCHRMRDSVEGSRLLTADDPGVRDIPPYLLVPKSVMLSDEDGNVKVFSDADGKRCLDEFGNHLMTLPEYPVFVGWYLDQVVVPCLASNAVVYGASLPAWAMRNLNDKWSKTVGHSVERAFMQGWYPSSHADFDDDRTYLTLDQAASLCGIDGPSERYKTFDGVPDDMRALMARIATTSALFARYRDILSSGNRR